MSDRVTFLLKTLHWLPISPKIQTKVLTVPHKALTFQIFHYLSDLILLYLAHSFPPTLFDHSSTPLPQGPCTCCSLAWLSQESLMTHSLINLRSLLFSTYRLLHLLSNLFIHPVYLPSSLECKLQ